MTVSTEKFALRLMAPSDNDFQIVGTNIEKEILINDPQTQTITAPAVPTPGIDPCDEEDVSVVAGINYYTLVENPEQQTYEYQQVTPVGDENPYELGWYKSVPVKREIVLPRADAIVISIADTAKPKAKLIRIKGII